MKLKIGGMRTELEGHNVSLSIDFNLIYFIGETSERKSN